MELPDPERWAQINTLLAKAQARPADERAAFLTRACDDPDLRREVASLLEAADTHEPLLDAGAAALAQPLLPAETDAAVPSMIPSGAGRRVGPYRLQERVGKGGTSTVYRAERTDGRFERTVAVKVLRRVLTEEETAERFRAERQILASLSHPHLAEVYDGGVTDDERPYLVMEYVDGRPITEHCRAEDCSVPERLELFRQAAEAVQAAHEQLVVHRDLKPSNVLVERNAGHVKLLDFGIAKILGDLPGDTPTTRTGQQPMTPAYAAPEQVQGEAIRTATDTYALGVLLYELLSGARPYGGEERSPYAIARAVCEDDPPPPSERIDDADQREVLRGDLDAIVMKALRKAPDARYDTVDALLDDLDRYRTDRAVQARRGGWGYRTRKFVRRHRGILASVLVAVLLLSAAATYHVRRLSAERNRARREAETAEQVAGYLAGLFEASNPYRQPDTVTARRLLRRGERRIERLDEQPGVQARLLSAMGRAHSGLGHYDTADSLLHRALTLRRRHRGNTHPSVARTLSRLSTLAGNRYQWAKAKRYAREAHAILRRRGAPRTRSDSLLVAGVLRAHAEALENTGAPDSAETFIRRALSLQQAVTGRDHADVWNMKTTLASVLREQGQFGAARRVYRELLVRQRARGDSLKVAETLNNLGYLHRMQGRLSRAERRYRTALQIYEDKLGPAHPTTLVVRGNNLSFVHALQDDFAAAVRGLREQLRAVRARYAADHWRVGKWAYLLGEKLLFRGTALDEATTLLREAAHIFEASDVTGPRYTLQPKAVLGHCLARRGRYDRARPLLEEARAVFGADSARDPLDWAHATVGLGLYHLGQGRYPRAESLLTAAHDTLRSLYGDAPGVDTTLRPVRQVEQDLVRLYERWGRPGQAEKYRASRREPTRATAQ